MADVGRPPKWESVEELKEKIDDYFNSCFKPMINKSGEIIRDDDGNPLMYQDRPFTVSGLAYHLDTSRQTLINYQNKDEYFDTITRAKQRCEVYTEESLFDKNTVNGAKFSLSNNFNGWHEKHQVESTNTNMNLNKDVSQLSDDELDAELSKYMK